MKCLFNILFLLSTTVAFHTGPTKTAIYPKVVVDYASLGRISKVQQSRRYASPSLLSMSENDASQFEKETKKEKKIQGRKQRVVIGYRAAAMAHMSLAAFSFLKLGFAPLPVFAAAGSILASGVAFILSGASLNDRLSSDTYKRLNLILAEYGLVGIIIAVVDKSGTFPTPLFIVPSLLAFINAVKGYGYGALGWDKKSGNIVRDLVEGTKTSAKVLISVPKNMRSAGYLAATFMVGGLELAKFFEVLQLVMKESIVGSNGFLIATRLHRLRLLALLLVVVFTLKDAADRDRLEGTTFIELNFLSSFVFVTMAVYTWQVASQTILGGAAAFFSLFSAANGVSSVMKKKSAA